MDKYPKEIIDNILKYISLHIYNYVNGNKKKCCENFLNKNEKYNDKVINILCNIYNDEYNNYRIHIEGSPWYFMDIFKLNNFNMYTYRQTCKKIYINKKYVLITNIKNDEKLEHITTTNKKIKLIITSGDMRNKEYIDYYIIDNNMYDIKNKNMYEIKK